MTELHGTFDAANADWSKLFGEAPKSIDDIDVIGLHDKTIDKKREFVAIDRVLDIIESEEDCGTAWNMQRALIDKVWKLRCGESASKTEIDRFYWYDAGYIAAKEEVEEWTNEMLEKEQKIFDRLLEIIDRKIEENMGQPETPNDYVIACIDIANEVKAMKGEQGKTGMTKGHFITWG